jgi:hypothetical protein
MEMVDGISLENLVRSGTGLWRCRAATGAANTCCRCCAVIARGRLSCGASTQAAAWAELYTRAQRQRLCPATAAASQHGMTACCAIRLQVRLGNPMMHPDDLLEIFHNKLNHTQVGLAQAR